VKVQNRKLIVDGSEFQIKGIAYSPVPIGESVHLPPHGDYFTPDYAYIWKRDLKAVKEAGFNTLRIYNINSAVNHAPFFDHANEMGLKVMLTHYIGDHETTPVRSDGDRRSSQSAFADHVARYGDHPAILLWSFGNEVNGVWQGFKQDLSDAFACGWDQTCENQPAQEGSCYHAQDCVYKALFDWVNGAAVMAKSRGNFTRPITASFADVDFLVGTNTRVDKLARFDQYLPDIDVHTIQLYKGKSFGGYFSQFAAESQKPLIVGEYGIDSFNDPCGWPENANQAPCFNGPNFQFGGSDATSNFQGCTTGGDCARPGSIVQSEWDVSLTREILHPNARDYGVVGGFLMSWHDEYWKNIETQDRCEDPCPTVEALSYCSDPSNDIYQTLQPGGSAKCTEKAHVTCSDYDTKVHDICGYYLPSSPDHYVNEAWFGVNGVGDCGDEDRRQKFRLTYLQPKPTMTGIANVFTGTGSDLSTPLSCSDLRPCYTCVRNHHVNSVASGACDGECGLKFSGRSYVGPLSGSIANATISFMRLITQLVVAMMIVNLLKKM